MKESKRLQTEDKLIDALIKSYVARAKLFYSILQKKNINKLSLRIKDCIIKEISWDVKKIGISDKAFSIIKKASIGPEQIFCHPEILNECPELVEYYRNLAALSQKGFNQILSGKLSKLSKGDNRERYQLIAETLNKLISSVITDIDNFTLALAKEAVIAEIGTEIQGTWVNIIGKGAAKAVEEIIYDYAHKKGYITSTELPPV
jgi:hypothetical protein